MVQIDTSTEFGQRVERRLREERIIWLTTVRRDGQPVPVPVWFLWDGGSELLMYSRPNTPKLRNIARNPRVALNFNSDEYGNDVIYFEAEARHDPNVEPANTNAAFIEKYRDGIASIDMTPDSFAATYSAPVRLRLTRVRGF